MAQNIGIEKQQLTEGEKSIEYIADLNSGKERKQLGNLNLRLLMQYDHLETISNYFKKDASANKSANVPNNKLILGIDNELFYFIAAAVLSLGAYLLWSEDEPKAEKKLTFGLPPVPIE